MTFSHGRSAASHRPILWESWILNEEADRRFRKTVARVGVPVLALVLVFTFWKLEVQLRVVDTAPVKQYVQLLPERAVAVHREETKSSRAKNAKAREDATPPAPAPSNAREVAQQSGLLKLRDQLAALRDSPLSAANAPLSSSTARVFQGSASADMLAAGAAADSGGIGGASGSVGVQGGTALGSRRTGSVGNPFASGRGSGTTGSGEAARAGRTLEEIQLAFDRSKNAFFAIFNRAARESTGVGAGKIVVSLTIAPDGTVSRCELVSSSFANADLEGKVLQRVKGMNFGAKAVPPFTYSNYPINFIPS